MAESFEINLRVLQREYAAINQKLPLRTMFSKMWAMIHDDISNEDIDRIMYGSWLLKSDIDHLKAYAAGDINDLDTFTVNYKGTDFFAKYGFTPNEIYGAYYYTQLSRPVVSDYYNYPGRSDKLDQSKWERALADYALNMDKYEKLFKAVKSKAAGHLKRIERGE